MLWMTSASELFHSRRYRSGLRHNAVDVSGFDSSLTDVTSSSSHQHRTTIRRHSHHYSSQNNRHEHRHDFDSCVPASRRIHRRRLDHSEHEPVHMESDRLPGSVLLARERLVERLRGVSVSGTRQSSGSSSTTHQNDFSTNAVLEIRNERIEEEMASESWTRRNYPPGLAQDELKCLQLEVFSNENYEKTNEISRECTICLEGFQDGDTLVRLHCTHRFHSCCLFPWVRVCGACPNCRKPILENVPVKQ